VKAKGLFGASSREAGTIQLGEDGEYIVKRAALMERRAHMFQRMEKLDLLCQDW
jgi:hypothetical protein